ncbi:hypothetical protein BTO06_12545 [Tenacibaculum sp. SZ-18]|uniref:hypothetical protein n=1 Tax=Tenacibaculum sp. SZ-18 TaxID=754423 RepID=UPI000C2CF31E|nr:hypothetical protein [Tenacibaculum sp. SZ-18]AUC15928.1 hypothetical protein BTO06_12545 [Tenacibaculum sp. SZ-18]
MKRIIVLFLVLALTACDKEDLYSDLGELSGSGVIEIGTHNVSGVIGEVFTKYIYTTAPNGGRIEIFGTSGVTDDQMNYAREILVQYLTKEGAVYKIQHKEIIANSMTNKRSALVFFDTEEQYNDNIDKVQKAGYNVQDLYATESLGSIEGDGSYEEILHLVHNYGIAPTLFNYQNKLQKANDDAISKGLYNPNGDDFPEADFDDEYFAEIMNCFLGLGSNEEEYKPSTRAEMQTQDPAGYQLILDLFGDIQLVR